MRRTKKNESQPQPVVLNNDRVLETYDEEPFFGDPEDLGETAGGNGCISAIVLVHTPGYVPPGVELRLQISGQLFTADLRPGDLERLRQDPQVAAVRVAERLPLVYR